MSVIERLTKELVVEGPAFDESPILKKWKLQPKDLHYAYLTFDRRNAVQVLDSTDRRAGREPALSALTALHSLSSPGLIGWIRDLTAGIDQAKAQFDELFKDLKDARQRIQNIFSDPVTILTKPLSYERHDLESRLIQYLVGGKCPTRLGDWIKLPGDTSDDPTLETVFGVLRIVQEDSAESQWKLDLPWLTDDKSPDADRKRKWEQKAGDLGGRLGAALGRSAAAGAQGLISTIVKLPDEVVKGIASVAGVTARKAAEVQMQRYLIAHPDLGPPAD